MALEVRSGEKASQWESLQHFSVHQPDVTGERACSYVYILWAVESLKASYGQEPGGARLEDGNKAYGSFSMSIREHPHGADIDNHMDRILNRSASFCP